MRTDVIGRNIDVTEAIRLHAEGKTSKLSKFYDKIQQITVTLSKADRHKTGDFSVELVVDVEHHDDFVSHATGPDLYAAIDEAAQKATRQLTEFKERLKQDHHRPGSR
ncbi:MAG: ribosome-associated translation inhibitor RaiA [Phycisphaerae bacterium]|nr:ribosome-associated translation inhibitor RaiA [Phycisphaerae bacterium]